MRSAFSFFPLFNLMFFPLLILALCHFSQFLSSSVYSFLSFFTFVPLFPFITAFQSLSLPIPQAPYLLLPLSFSLSLSLSLSLSQSLSPPQPHVYLLGLYSKLVGAPCRWMLNMNALWKICSHRIGFLEMNLPRKHNWVQGYRSLNFRMFLLSLIVLHTALS